MPEGRYSKVLNESNLNKLKDWVKSGGKIIALGRAVGAFEGKEGFDLDNNKEDK